MNVKSRLSFEVVAVAFLTVLMCGCAERNTPAPVAPPEVKLVPVFPPQKVMEGGSYEDFMMDNLKAVRECAETGTCDEALFNLGFLYSYPGSPYYNKSKGLEYFDRLVRSYPRSVWAFQARAWSEIIRKSISAGTGKKEKNRQDLQKELKSKDAVINDLQQKLDRTREIDMEVEKKERQLLK